MKAPAFLFYTGDFLSSPDVQLMTAYEVGAYCLLLFNAWQYDRQGYLPNDENRFRRVARLTTEQWAESRELLLSKFPVAPDDSTKRYNPRLAKEAIKQAIKRERLAANGRKGGRIGKPMGSDENQMPVENSLANLADESEKQLLSITKQKLSKKKLLPTQNEAIEKAFNFNFTTSNEVEREVNASLAHTSVKQQINEVSAPTLAQVQAYATHQHPDNTDAQVEAIAFIDYYTSNGWRMSGKAQMVNWKAGFRNWMRRRPQFQTTSTGSSTSTPARARTAPKPADPSRWS